ncbi:hypothetical protein HanPSC8_Chr02g0072921 [Helianthus annuus]|nr:hypothetical protein HanPSC8_Chr02g0072921 [Helianthus annuus]
MILSIISSLVFSISKLSSSILNDKNVQSFASLSLPLSYQTNQIPFLVKQFCSF